MEQGFQGIEAREARDGRTELVAGTRKGALDIGL